MKVILPREFYTTIPLNQHYSACRDKSFIAQAHCWPKNKPIEATKPPKKIDLLKLLPLCLLEFTVVWGLEGTKCFNNSYSNWSHKTAKKDRSFEAFTAVFAWIHSCVRIGGYKVFQQLLFAWAFKLENHLTFTLNIQSSGFTTRCRFKSWCTFASVISLEIDTFSSVGAAK